MKERYEMLVFPSLYGSPKRTDCFAWAWVYCFFRSFGYAEARIIDRKTGKHIVF